MAGNTKVSIEPVISTPSAPKPVVKKIIKKIVKKVPTAPVVETPAVSASQVFSDTMPKESAKKKYADASSGVPLEVLNQRLLFLGIFVTVITVISVSTLLYLRSKTIIAENSEEEKVEDMVEEVVIEEEILATPEPKEKEEIVRIKREDITIEILNGSGVAGLAGDAALEMQELGYPLPDTGNSDRIEKSELYISDQIEEDQLENLLTDVKRRFNIDEVTDSIELETTAKIILGEDQE